MFIYLAHNDEYEHILREEKWRIIIRFANLKIPDDIPRGFDHVLIDSGGFQLQTGRGGSKRSVDEITVKEWAKFLKAALPHHPEIDGYFCLDMPDDPIATLDNKLIEAARRIDVPIFAA